MNPIQFNALAIVLILVGMPFAIAFITNAGSSSEKQYIDSMEEGYYAPVGAGFADPSSRWLYNGGDNATSLYDAQYPNALATTCIYVHDGWCRGDDPPGVYYVSNYLAASPLIWEMPAASVQMYQSHTYGLQGVNNPTYLGASGDSIFGWRFSNNYFQNFPTNGGIDSFRFGMIDSNTTYACGSSSFTNITFEGELIFRKDNYSKSYSGFNFETSNSFDARYTDLNGHWVDACFVGFSLEFDLTGFESLELDSFVHGDWQNTTIDLLLTNFEREDGQNFADTKLPFAGIETWRLSIEHSEVNSVEAGFIIKTGTIVLSVATFVLAIASTPYWDPFRNLVKGAID